MSIGDNIKRLREAHDLTQEQLGEIAGATDKAVSTWEKGKAVPRMGAIQKMADHFGISKSDIIEDKEKPVAKYDELDRIGAALIMKLSPQNRERLLGYAARLLEEQSNESFPRE